MTPLAWRMTQELMKKPADQMIKWGGDETLGRFTGLQGVHCYDVGAVTETVVDLVEGGANPHGILSFAPGERVWVEMARDLEGSAAAYFVERARGNIYRLFVVMEASPPHKGLGVERLGLYEMPLTGASVFLSGNKPLKDKDGATGEMLARCVRGFFTIINRPQNINLRTVRPHKGRQKRLDRAFGTGQFPLRAWHEITIQQHTKDHEGKAERSVATGRMPLHHVRAYYKPSLGIIIPEHWRGDAALGIKQTRYKVKGTE